MNRIIDWYQNLPRWLEFGINSFLAALGIRLFVILLLPTTENLLWMTLGVTDIFYAYFTPNLPFIVEDIFTFGFWFIIGAILGRFIEKSNHATIIWAIILIIGWVFVFLFLNVPSNWYYSP